MSVGGHFWTIAPWLRHQVRPEPVPTADPWETHLEDPQVGRVRLTGLLRERVKADTLVLVVHGLGGSSDAQYACAAARAIDAHGLACLRLDLRGADRRGEDLHHAGLVEDLQAALASEALERYRRIVILGYSMGGHVSLRLACVGPLDPRVTAVVAVCPPLDLEWCASEIDRPASAVYRLFVLRGLVEIYEAVARRRPSRLTIREARAIRGLREWDRRIVAPRFGFPSAEHYYAAASAGPHLPSLKIPGLVVPARHDPMIPAHTVEPALRRAPAHLDVRWMDLGGHVGFPRDLDLGMPGPRGLEPQVLTWALSHG